MEELPDDPEVRKRVQTWLAGPYDARAKETIRSLLKSDPEQIVDAFYTDLSFGTGGLRGIMGIGTNRMNEYTVRIATQGLASYILKHVQRGSTPSVFVGYDSRINSRFFAEQTAQVLAGSGIEVYLTQELCPTPFVSFGVRHKKCIAGVMITASHNPAEYNGYKVYWSDGGQVVAPHDKGIMQEAYGIKRIEQVHIAPIDSPLIHRVDHSVTEAYLAALQLLEVDAARTKHHGSRLKIVYTSLHGTGITLVPPALKEWGFTSLSYVDQQIVPDGNFPTVKFPNPEYPEALKLGTEKLVKSSADIFIATDPDADRMGAVVMHQGKPVALNGNEIASLCAYFLCDNLKRQGRLTGRKAIVTTIVSTELMPAIAASFGIPCFEVLTGFKYIGEMIHKWEKGESSHDFLFGAEESYGYLYGTHARDKDAVISSCLIADIALHAKLEKRTLVDLLYDLYARYGVFKECQFSLNFKPGKEGMEEMEKLMQRMRSQAPSHLCGQKVTLVEDYLSGQQTDLLTGKIKKLTLPRSDVLLFRLADASKVIIRPSGTEPKIKIYAGVHTRQFSLVEEGIASCNQRLDAMLLSLQKECAL